ncbi:MAG: ferredoxin-type protein NapF [Proteobacteria bacterium]|nr:ferredoxin-type protein NapF [Pseudomonadota bacterium]
MNPSRRSFLRGRSERGGMLARPPWSLPEALFTELCTRCGDCIEHCDAKILHKGDGGFPKISFDSNGCSFCKKCVQVCKSGALSSAVTPWQLKAVIGSACLARNKVICRTCGERCEAGALSFRPTQGGVATPQLDLNLCTGCGACVADCPGHAISLSDNFEEVFA